MTRRSRMLRASIVAATLVVIGAALVTPGASPTAMGWFVAAAALACSVGAYVLPDGHSASGAIALLLVYWLMVVDDGLSVLTPVVAACIVVVHTASSIESITPPGSRLDRATYRRWAARTLLVIGVGCALWLVAVGADRAQDFAGVLIVLLFGLVAGAGIWALRVRLLSRPGG
ncbi:MAG TPA: hypothetical protein VK059_05950 [Nocardioidaceae bacterium]|nr:hypothetical protein [Nocardioidaceae bacterium]